MPAASMRRAWQCGERCATRSRNLKFPKNRVMARCEPDRSIGGENKMSVFGFPIGTSTGGGDFTPVLKYDARAGRFFRIDRVSNGDTFTNEPVEMPSTMRFVADFENIEVGWMLFAAGMAPDYRLVPMGHQMPDRPSPNHKNGVRFMLKLAPDCAGDRPIREISATSNAFLTATEAVYTRYLDEKDDNPGKLPVLTVDKISPVKSGTGAQSSTNYHPTFKISGWSARPKDLVFEPKASAAP